MLDGIRTLEKNNRRKRDQEHWGGSRRFEEKLHLWSWEWERLFLKFPLPISPKRFYFQIIINRKGLPYEDSWGVAIMRDFGSWVFVLICHLQRQVLIKSLHFPLFPYLPTGDNNLCILYTSRRSLLVSDKQGVPIESCHLRRRNYRRHKGNSPLPPPSHTHTPTPTFFFSLLWNCPLKWKLSQGKRRVLAQSWSSRSSCSRNYWLTCPAMGLPLWI